MNLDLSRFTVAVVDDNRFIRRVATEILRNFNVGRIVEADSGAAAIEKLASEPPDVIFCDWLMKPMSGIEFLRKVRRNETPIHPATPIVMMTGQLEAMHVLEARAAGVTGYIAKPVTVEGMMNNLVDIIRMKPPALQGVETRHG